jgi:hypothetical protein
LNEGIRCRISTAWEDQPDLRANFLAAGIAVAGILNLITVRITYPQDRYSCRSACNGSMAVT